MRVEFKTDALNERSRGALGALGAQFEGIFRKHMVYPDRIRDSAYFAIVDGEPVWIYDAYTTTDQYPYSQALDVGALNRKNVSA